MTGFVFSFRCQWQVEANGAISPALTPSPSPLPLTIEEDREFTYPSDVLIPPPGLMPGTYFDLPRIRLPPGIMGRLREVSGRARPLIPSCLSFLHPFPSFLPILPLSHSYKMLQSKKKISFSFLWADEWRAQHLVRLHQTRKQDPSARELDLELFQLEATDCSF